MKFRHFIPHLFTFANLLCGSVAIWLLVGQRELLVPCLLIGLAAIFDMFDGRVARMLNVESNIGRDLDSLADVISFGLAPAFIAVLIPVTDAEGWQPIRLAGLLIVIMSAYRLARYNTEPSNPSFFSGLATPANAVFWGSLACVSWELGLRSGMNSAMPIFTQSTILIFVVIFSLLLVSRVPFFKFKFRGSSWKENMERWIYVVLIPVIMLLVYFATGLVFLGITVLVVIYVILCIGFNFLKKQNEVQS